jgi:hypothetical protein
METIGNSNKGMQYSVQSMPRRYKQDSESVSREKLVAEAGDKPGEGEHLPLEVVTRRLVKTQQTDKTQMCALVNCKVCELVKQL